jgi:hypothetical protein
MNNNLRYLNGLIFECVVNTLQGPNINLPNSYNVIILFVWLLDSITKLWETKKIKQYEKVL